MAVADIWPCRRALACCRLRAVKREAHADESLEELLLAGGDKVDAVLVATPDWLHAVPVTATSTTE